MVLRHRPRYGLAAMLDTNGVYVNFTGFIAFSDSLRSVGHGIEIVVSLAVIDITIHAYLSDCVLMTIQPGKLIDFVNLPLKSFMQ